MPSEKNIKSLEALSESFSRSTVIISTNYSGLSVESLTDLRRQLKKDSIDYKIGKKNTYVAGCRGQR